MSSWRRTAPARLTISCQHGSHARGHPGYGRAPDRPLPVSHFALRRGWCAGQLRRPQDGLGRAAQITAGSQFGSQDHNMPLSWENVRSSRLALTCANTARFQVRLRVKRGQPTRRRPRKQLRGTSPRRRARLPWCWQHARHVVRTSEASQQSQGPRQQQKRKVHSGYCGGSGLRGGSGAFRSPRSTAGPRSTTVNPVKRGIGRLSSADGGPSHHTDVAKYY
jgi:hypothetical protein